MTLDLLEHEKTLLENKINQSVLYCLHIPKHFTVLFNPNTLNPSTPNNYYPSTITYGGMIGDQSDQSMPSSHKKTKTVSSFIAEQAFVSPSQAKGWELNNFYHNTLYPSVIESKDIDPDQMFCFYKCSLNHGWKDSLVKYLFESIDLIPCDSFIFQGTIAFHVSRAVIKAGLSEVVTELTPPQKRYFEQFSSTVPDILNLLHVKSIGHNTFQTVFGNKRLLSISAHETVTMLNKLDLDVDSIFPMVSEKETALSPPYLRNRNSLINKETGNLNSYGGLLNWTNVFNQDYLNDNLDDFDLFPTSFLAPIVLKNGQLIVV